ncbi:AAA family ATPase [Micromonospora sp. NPDC047557]|uniref:AAA family ATPase n=1 Tax=Micromonospora sp. NPDC047557 TaxID=3364250 RepID=UPI003723956E
MDEHLQARDVFAADTMHVYYGRPGSYRVSRWAPPDPVPPHDLAPSQLLDVRNRIVPFHGRAELQGELSAWRDDQSMRCAVLLVHAPGGHGKTRLADKFAADSAQAGWQVGEAFADTSRHQPLLDLRRPGDTPGLLVVIDYAERWPSELLMDCCGRLTRVEHPLIRVLLLARPSSWWDGVRHTIVDIHRYRARTERLDAVAASSAERRLVFDTARDCFAKAMGVSDPQAIHPLMDLTDSKFDSVLETHMAALVAVDAARSGARIPGAPDELSDYLLRREQQHWSDMHAKGRISTREHVMRRTVFVATLTGAVSSGDGIKALRSAGLADTRSDGELILQDHGLCYPPARSGTVLTPLYPDRLAEDFIALQLPGLARGAAVGEPWAGAVPLELPEAHRGRMFTMLSEASQRYPHIDPELLLRLRPEPESAMGVPEQPPPAVDTFRGAAQALLPLAPTLRQETVKLLGYGVNRTAQGWRDYLTHAAALARRLLATVPRVAELTGPRRRQATLAIHTVVAVKALLEAIDEALPTGPYGGPPVPAPGVSQLAATSLGPPEKFLEKRDDRFQALVRAVLADIAPHIDSTMTLNDALRRCAEDYVRVAVSLPELATWSLLAEHARAQGEIRQQTSALRGLVELLSDDPLPELPAPQAMLVKMHRAELQRPLFPPTEGVHSPTVEEAYLTPRYRAAMAKPGQPIWDHGWWASQSARDDIDVFLFAHLTQPGSVERPLLVLGAPGSGKTMLLKVLAAQLPATNFTTVRVPLRTVDPNAPVYEQVQQALHYTSNGRIAWSELAAYGDTTVRVLLLDGVDEMGGHGAERLSYLAELAQFQKIEAQLGRPVAVIVTGRSAPSDRLLLPEQTPVALLEAFDDERITRWLHVWNQTNADEIAARSLVPITVQAVQPYRQMADRPLLLLLLALHLAHNGADQEATPVDLYGALVERVIRRELALAPNRSVDDELGQLGILALAGFNRGRLMVSEDEVARDLTALDAGGDRTAALLARYPLVYTSSSTYAGSPSRSYEFLHATIAEYLAAAHLVRLLDELAKVPWPPGGRPSYDMLRALLSHQPLSARLPILTMAMDLTGALSQASRSGIPRLLESALAEAALPTIGFAYPDYQPTPPNLLARFAAYTANLVLLRVALAEPPGGVAISALAPANADPVEFWRSTVRAWAAGLPFDTWATVIDQLELAGARIVRRSVHLAYDARLYLAEAELCGDADLVRILSNGLADD